MLILLISIATCVITTALLVANADAKWFTTLAGVFFVITALGGERTNITFAHEHEYFFSLSLNYFIFLAAYFFLEPKEPTYILGTPKKKIPNRPLFASAALIAFGFGLPFLYLGQAVLEPTNWALILLSVYMGIVGIFLFRRAWRVRKLRLELQKSLRKR